MHYTSHYIKWAVCIFKDNFSHECANRYTLSFLLTKYCKRQYDYFNKKEFDVSTYVYIKRCLNVLSVQPLATNDTFPVKTAT